MHPSRLGEPCALCGEVGTRRSHREDGQTLWNPNGIPDLQPRVGPRQRTYPGSTVTAENPTPTALRPRTDHDHDHDHDLGRNPDGVGSKGDDLPGVRRLGNPGLKDGIPLGFVSHLISHPLKASTNLQPWAGFPHPCHRVSPRRALGRQDEATLTDTWISRPELEIRCVPPNPDPSPLTPSFASFCSNPLLRGTGDP